MPDIFRLGAVAYDPKVVLIWEGFKAYFQSHDFDFDFVLYSNYEAQVRAHLRGDFDVAWNSPLAWISTQRTVDAHGATAQAIAMRDSDRDLTSLIIVRKDDPIETLSDLKGRRVGVGAQDSPQATLIPLLYLVEAGLEPGRDLQVHVHDALVGKHGDHIGGEREAVRALIAREVDAACIIDSNYLRFSQEGSLPPRSARILLRTASYDHCNFTLLERVPTGGVDRFTQLLFDMEYRDPKVRPLLDMEGLRKWETGRISGYGLLNRAVDRFGMRFTTESAEKGHGR